MDLVQLRSKSRTLVAMDFGTAYTRVTYGHLSWQNGFHYNYLGRLSIPSVLRYNRLSREPSICGEEARIAPEDASHTARCRDFKRFLCQKVAEDDKSANGRHQPIWERFPIQKSALELSMDFLKCVYVELEKISKEDNRPLNIADCHFLVSFPPYFNDTDAEKFEDAVTSRFSTSIVTILPEPEMAAVYAIDTLKKGGHFDLKKVMGKGYRSKVAIICDVGASVKILPFQLPSANSQANPETTAVKSDSRLYPYGGTSIEDKFRNYLRNEIPDIIDRRRFENSLDEQKSMEEFIRNVVETSKLSNPQQGFRFKLHGDILKKYIQMSPEGYFFDIKKWELYLEECISPTVLELKNCIEDCEKARLSVQCVFVTGALGILPTFVGGINKQFFDSGIDIIGIDNGEWAVSKGMVTSFLREIKERDPTSAHASYGFPQAGNKTEWFLGNGREYATVHETTSLETLPFDRETESYCLSIERHHGEFHTGEPNRERFTFNVYLKDIERAAGAKHTGRPNLPVPAVNPRRFRITIMISGSRLEFIVQPENEEYVIETFTIHDA